MNFSVRNKKDIQIEPFEVLLQFNNQLCINQKNSNLYINKKLEEMSYVNEYPFSISTMYDSDLQNLKLRHNDAVIIVLISFRIVHNNLNLFELQDNIQQNIFKQFNDLFKDFCREFSIPKDFRHMT